MIKQLVLFYEKVEYISEGINRELAMLDIPSKNIISIQTHSDDICIVFYRDSI